jgi:hypothetical protein
MATVGCRIEYRFVDNWIIITIMYTGHAGEAREVRLVRASIGVLSCRTGTRGA